MQIPVSVIIPILKNYNNYLTEALNSIEFQSYTPKEILVIGNIKNNKNIKEICKKYKNCFFFSTRKTSASYRRYFGALNAKYKYLSFIDYDDLWTKNRLKYLYKKINVGNCIAVYGKKIFFYKKKKSIETRKDLTFLLTTALIKKKILITEKYFNNQNILAEYIFYKKLSLQKKKIIKINKIVLYRRIHDNNFTKNLKTKKMIINTLKYINKKKY